MPSANEHLRQAEHNEEFARTLLNRAATSYTDWVVTAAFYAALHFVNYYFVRVAGVAPADHKIRSSYMQREAATRSIVFEYETLRSRRVECTYHCRVPSRETAQRLLDHDLQAIKSVTVPSS
jgi:hypothetical protein